MYICIQVEKSTFPGFFVLSFYELFFTMKNIICSYNENEWALISIKYI